MDSRIEGMKIEGTCTAADERDNLSLTEDQQRALIELQDFVRSGQEKCFLLEGYAGTGKTFLIRRFVQWLESENLSFLLAAPTGRAGKVLADKTGYAAGTIHRAIYCMNKLKEIPGEEDRFKSYFELKVVADEARARVILVDEASMVSDRADDEKFIRFGSGRVLKDLLEFAGERQADSKCQVVFVGDPAQLPPVNMDTSPALDENYLKAEYGVNVRKALLRQVVRQMADSAILKAATQIRADIEAGRENRLAIVPDGKEILDTTPSKVCDLWQAACPPGQDLCAAPPFVCVTWTNQMALAYNVSVRARLHGREDGRHPVCARDYLMVVANNRKTGLCNGELALVTYAADKPEIHPVDYRVKGGGAGHVDLSFRAVELAVPDGDGASKIISSLILENALFGKVRDVTEDEQIALWVDFKKRNPHLRPNTDEFTLAVTSDPYFNALRVKFGYAVTCHKAQGGEWPSAVVVFENGRTDIGQLRWTYTAITRAKQTLYGVGFPRIGMRNWRVDPAPALETEFQAESEALAESAAATIGNGHDMEAFRRAGYPPELDWMAGLHYAAVEEWLRVGIEVEKVECHIAHWFVRYQLYRAGHRAWMQFTFNRRKKTTLADVRPLTLPQSGELLEACRQGFVRAQEQALSRSSAPEAVPVELREWREDFVEPAVARLGGVILRVESLPYRERYEIRTAGSGLAVLDFCYDKRMRMKQIPEIQTQTTDPAFARNLIAEIEQ